MRQYILFHLFTSLSNFAFRWFAGVAGIMAVAMFAGSLVLFRYPSATEEERKLWRHKARTRAAYLLDIFVFAALAVLLTWWTYSDALSTLKIMIGVPALAVLIAAGICALMSPPDDNPAGVALLGLKTIVYPFLLYSTEEKAPFLALLCAIDIATTAAAVFSGIIKQTKEDWKNRVGNIDDVNLSTLDDNQISTLIRTSEALLKMQAKLGKKKGSTRFWRNTGTYSWRLLYTIGVNAPTILRGYNFGNDAAHLSNTSVEIPFEYFRDAKGTPQDRPTYKAEFRFDMEKDRFLITVFGSDGEVRERREVYWPSYFSRGAGERMMKELRFVQWKGRLNSTKS